MGYHALLICADEKLTRIVSQLFFDIGFEVIASDPDRAAEAMADQCFDAIIADCRSDENMSLIFNSVRKSNFNKNSLTIALVEGQVGVFAAYRAGANLVLTKPINIEQAKGTLRIARGLLKKNAENSDQGGAALRKEPSAGQEHAAVRNATPEFTVPVATADHTHDDPFMAGTTTIGTKLEAEVPLPQKEMHQNVASAFGAKNGSNDGLPNLNFRDVTQRKLPTDFPEHAADFDAATETPDLARETAPRPNLHLPVPAIKESPRPAATGGTFSAAAAAPARETTNQPEESPREATHASGAPVPAKSVAAESVSANSVLAEPSSTKSVSAKSGWTPLTEPIKQTLTPNPAADDFEDSINDGAAVSYAMPAKAAGFSRIVTGVAIVVVVAAAGYFGWSRFGRKPAEARSNYLHVVELDQSGQTNPEAGHIAQVTGNKPVEGKSASGEIAPRRSTPAVNERPAPQSMAERIELVLRPNAAPPATPPLQVKPNTQASEKHAENEDTPVALPSLLAVAEPAQNGLSGLMSSGKNVSKPTLAQVRVSQGVSQGLLIKSVTPRYPQSALAAHRNGVVEIEATIDKEGHVVDPRVLGGNTVFNAPALEAVRQWRYKPYYLNGEPVEIRTQVTIRFKAD